jgi:hypothetical protein
MAVSKNNSSSSGNFGAIFHKNPLYEFAMDFVLVSMVKFASQKTC